MKRILCVIFLVAWLPLTIGAQRAAGDDRRVTRVYTTIAPASLDTYVGMSDEIAMVRCLGSMAVVPQRGLPFTQYKFQVLGAVKGYERGLITIDVAGAETDSQIVIAPSAPRFQFGEAAVLFLERNTETGTYGILGLDQGTYRVATDSNGLQMLSGRHALNETPVSFLDRSLATWAVQECAKGGR